MIHRSFVIGIGAQIFDDAVDGEPAPAMMRMMTGLLTVTPVVNPARDMRMRRGARSTEPGRIAAVTDKWACLTRIQRHHAI